MSRHFSKLYYHLIFVTKYRDFMISERNEKLLYRFLWDKAVLLDAYPMMINGMQDHVHVLLKINPVDSVSEIVKNLKGSSARYMNELSGNQKLFQWSRGFGSFTVSLKDVDMIAVYIKNQKEHHQQYKTIPELEVDLLFGKSD